MEFILTAPTTNGEGYSLWEKAALSTNQADPFSCTPDWQLSFHDAFRAKRRLLIAETPGCAIAFAEEIVSPENIFLTPIESHWFFGCPLLGEYATELLSDSLEYVTRMYKNFCPSIVISGIRPDGMLARQLVRTFGSQFTMSIYSTDLLCAASLANGIDGYLSRRSAKHRSKLKTIARRAVEKGIYFERVLPTSVEEAKMTYSRMLSVEQASWKGIGQCGMTIPPARQFYGTMLQRLVVSKKTRVIFARHQTHDIGFIFGGMAGPIYRGQQFSYDNGWSGFSIGNLLQMEQIRWLCEEEAERYDMGPLQGPRMAYKSHWTEKEIKIQTWVLKK